MSVGTLTIALVPGYETIGGSTPAIVTYLIHATGNRAMPGVWPGEPRPNIFTIMCDAASSCPHLGSAACAPICDAPS
jgi:hypothetical protein